MPVSIADLGATRRTFTMETEAGAIQVTYRPYEMTPAREAAISRLASAQTEELSEDEGEDVGNTEGGLTKIIEQFCTVVEAWTLVGPLTNRETGKEIVKAGEPIPVNPSTMRYVSSYFMVRVLNAVADDIRPKKTRPNS